MPLHHGCRSDSCRSAVQAASRRATDANGSARRGILSVGSGHEDEDHGRNGRHSSERRRFTIRDPGGLRERGTFEHRDGRRNRAARRSGRPGFAPSLRLRRVRAALGAWGAREGASTNPGHLRARSFRVPAGQAARAFRGDHRARGGSSRCGPGRGRKPGRHAGDPLGPRIHREPSRAPVSRTGRRRERRHTGLEKATEENSRRHRWLARGDEGRSLRGTVDIGDPTRRVS